MVEAAKIAYRDYPTIVNKIPESGLSYDNNPLEYAKMDSKMQQAQKAIGGSSDSAQLSQSYMWTKVAKGEFDDEYKQLYENTVILAVLAQVAIDGCKKVFLVNPTDDIKRIRSQECMNREKDFPKFMQYAKDIPVMKNGRERQYSEIKRDRNKVKNRIDPSLVCPMNWLQDCLDKIQGIRKHGLVDTKEFFIKKLGKADPRQMSKIRKRIEEYDQYTKRIMGIINNDLISDEPQDSFLDYLEETEGLLSEVKGIKLSEITMNMLIATVLGLDGGIRSDRRYIPISKYTRKMMNLMYRTNKEMFFSNFTTE